MRKHNRYGLILIFLSTLLLHGCGEEQKIKEQLEKAEQHAQLSINRLRDALNDGHVTNASVLKSYSKNIASNYPEYKDLAIQLGLDAGTSGPLFSNLSRRLDDAIKYPDVFVTWQERYQELRSLSQASDISVFSDALSDPANVLSDMSEGRLPRVNAISRKAEQSQGASKQEVGQQLVGNPSYGNWRTHSSGRSFWEWYGMYSMFSNFYPSRYNYYDRWSSRRGYSYYNDVGRSSFTSPKQYQSQAVTDKKAKFRARKTGGSYNSPYSKQRSGATGLSKTSRSLNTKSYASRYSGLSNYKSSSYSKSQSSVGGSSRSSYSQRSRGLSLGK